ncbi:MAG: CRISPR-associated endonuclease Cas2, partial [bacterium]
MRKRYLITYDVADDKRRNAVFKLLMGNGDHVQYSVFLCDLNAAELARVKGELSEVMNHRRDQAIVLDLGPADNDLGEKLLCVGKAYTPPARVT